MKVQFLSPAWLLGTLVAAWMLLLSSPSGYSQETAPPPAAVESTASADAAPAAPVAEPAAKKFRRRLPAYFSTVVSSEQRQKVYDIQATFFDRIAVLEKQILELRAKQDQEVDAILSAEQLAEIKKLRAAAAAKRRSQPANQETASDGQP